MITICHHQQQQHQGHQDQYQDQQSRKLPEKSHPQRPAGLGVDDKVIIHKAVRPALPRSSNGEKNANIDKNTNVDSQSSYIPRINSGKTRPPTEVDIYVYA